MPIVELTPDKLLIVAAAGAVVFWPQIVDAVKRFRGTVPGGGVAADPAGPSASDVVVRLLDLQAAIEAAGNARAAGLVGQAVVEMVSGKPPAAGAKK